MNPPTLRTFNYDRDTLARRQPLEAPATRPPLEHPNLRGAAYFDLAVAPRTLPLLSEKEP